MKVLVDTCVWSLAFRRETVKDDLTVQELKELVSEQRAVLIGPVRQEILSGIATREQFLLLRDRLRAFPDHPLVAEDFELAAEYFTTCRLKGIQGANTDFLLCAVAVRHAMPLFTVDGDFPLFQNHFPIPLHQARTFA